MSDLPAFHSTLLHMMNEMNNQELVTRDVITQWYGNTLGSESQFYPPNMQPSEQEGAVYWSGNTSAESASWLQWTNHGEAQMTFDPPDTGQGCTEVEEQQMETYVAGEDKEVIAEITNIRTLSGSENGNLPIEQGSLVTSDLCDTVQGCGDDRRPQTESCAAGEGSREVTAEITNVRSLSNPQNRNLQFEQGTAVTFELKDTGQGCGDDRRPQTELCAAVDGSREVIEEVTAEITNVMSLSSLQNRNLPFKQGTAVTFDTGQGCGDDKREQTESYAAGESSEQGIAEVMNTTRLNSSNNLEKGKCYVYVRPKILEVSGSEIKGENSTTTNLPKNKDAQDSISPTCTSFQNSQSRNCDSLVGRPKTVKKYFDDTNLDVSQKRSSVGKKLMHNGTGNDYVRIEQGKDLNNSQPLESHSPTLNDHPPGDRKHKCSVCQKKFKRSSHLKDHMFIHTAKRPFQCSLCKKGFNRRRAAAQHIRNMHASRILEAEIIQSIFSEAILEETGDEVNQKEQRDGIEDESDTADVHHTVPVVADKEVEPREDMSKSVDFDSVIPSDENLPSIGKGYACSECDRSFFSMWHLSMHMSSKHTKLKLECFVCKKPFYRQSHLQRHVRRVHKGMAFDELGDSVIKRLVCFQNDLSSKLGLDEGAIEQAILVDEANTLQSEFVGSDAVQAKEIQHSERLDKPVGRKHPSARDRYMCSVCGKQCSCSSHLREHMYAHTREKPFRCSVCDKKFKRVRDLRYHSKEQHPEICTYVCECGERFASETQLVIHRRVHKTCLVCSAMLDDEGAYAAHMAEHREKRLKCPQCEQVFVWQRNLNEHLKLHEMGVTKDCSHCPESFCTLEDCAKHIKRHVKGRIPSEAYRKAVRAVSQSSNEVLHPRADSEDAVMIEEKLADNSKDIERFASDTAALKRIPLLKLRRVKICSEGGSCNLGGSAEQGQPNVTLLQETCAENGFDKSLKPFTTKTGQENCSRKEEHQCPICDFSCAIRGAFLKHMIRHRDKTVKRPRCPLKYHTSAQMKQHAKPFQCIQCRERFANKYALNRHMKLHSEKNFCTICNRHLRSASCYEEHMRGHRDKKPFECVQCRQTFLRKQSLNIHMRRHAGIKPHKCPVCKEKYFYTNAERSRHLLLFHKEEKYHICAICDMRFATKEEKLQHREFTKGETPHNCLLCDQKFSQVCELNRHIKAHTEEIS